MSSAYILQYIDNIIIVTGLLNQSTFRSWTSSRKEQEKKKKSILHRVNWGGGDTVCISYAFPNIKENYWVKREKDFKMWFSRAAECHPGKSVIASSQNPRSETSYITLQA